PNRNLKGKNRGTQGQDKKGHDLQRRGYSSRDSGYCHPPAESCPSVRIRFFQFWRRPASLHQDGDWAVGMASILVVDCLPGACRYRLALYSDPQTLEAISGCSGSHFIESTCCRADHL